MIRASSPLDAMAQRLAHVFEQPALLRQALTHRSYSATHNERLEFLGDSVLNCVVATLLYQRFPELDEGELSRVRANLVRQETLHGIAQRLDVSGALALGEGELKSGGKQRPSILADAVEALFGAIYLDGGFVAAFNAIARAYDPVFAALDPDMLGKDANKDAKTLLQERLQGRQMALPVYTVVATIGAAHNQEFEVACTVEPLGIAAHGRGTSRRAAERAAAKAALALMPAEVAKGAKAAAVRKDSARGQGRPTKAGAPAADGKQINPSHKTLRVLRSRASGSSSGNADRPGAAAEEALTVERTGETAGRADRPTEGKRPVRRAGPAAK